MDDYRVNFALAFCCLLGCIPLVMLMHQRWWEGTAATAAQKVANMISKQQQRGRQDDAVVLNGATLIIDGEKIVDHGKTVRGAKVPDGVFVSAGDEHGRRGIREPVPMAAALQRAPKEKERAQELRSKRKARAGRDAEKKAAEASPSFNDAKGTADGVLEVTLGAVMAEAAPSQQQQPSQTQRAVPAAVEADPRQEHSSTVPLGRYGGDV